MGRSQQSLKKFIVNGNPDKHLLIRKTLFGNVEVQNTI